MITRENDQELQTTRYECKLCHSVWYEGQEPPHTVIATLLDEHGV